MAVETAQIAVDTTPVLLTSPGQDYSQRGDLSSTVIQAPTAAVLYVGADDVTSTTGWPIPAGQILRVDLQAGERLYGVLAAGAEPGTAYVLRTGV